MLTFEMLLDELRNMVTFESSPVSDEEVSKKFNSLTKDQKNELYVNMATRLNITKAQAS